MKWLRRHLDKWRQSRTWGGRTIQLTYVEPFGWVRPRDVGGGEAAAMGLKPILTVPDAHVSVNINGARALLTQWEPGKHEAKQRPITMRRRRTDQI